MPTLELKPIHEPVQHYYTALRQHPQTATAAMYLPGGEASRESLTLKGWRALSGYDDNSTEFSDLERRADTSIRHPVKSRIIYNATLEATSVSLGADKYYDVQGNKLHGRVSLQPFESKILIAADYEVSAPALR